MQANFFVVRSAVVLSIISSVCSLAIGEISGEMPQTEQNVAGISESQTAAISVVEVKPLVVSGLGIPLEGGLLEDYRGGFDLVKNDMQLSGTVANNSATNISTGINSIADGSFTNVTGLPIVIQNSGSNVLIQNATIINLQYK